MNAGGITPYTRENWKQELLSEQGSLRRRAVIALSKLPTIARGLIPELGMALLHQDPLTRKWAARALGGLGRCALPQLVLALEHESAAVRALAARTLAWMPAQLWVVEELERLKSDESASVRRDVNKALSQLQGRILAPLPLSSPLTSASPVLLAG